MAETSTAATPMHEYLVPWVAGGFAGWRSIRAPDAASAEHDLREHASRYGLPAEHPVVGRALRRVLIDPEAVDACAD